MSCSGGCSCEGHGAVAAAADAILAQCAGFVEALPDRAYTADSRLIRGGSVGKHVRHVLDHFSAIFTAADLGEAIAYDRRERNVPMETQREHALTTIAELRGRVTQSGPTLGGTVRVRVMLSASGQEAELSSTVAWELAFATHHAIHHHAMMAAIAKELGLVTPAGFGKAPSTLHHERMGSRGEHSLG